MSGLLEHVACFHRVISFLCAGLWTPVYSGFESRLDRDTEDIASYSGGWFFTPLMVSL